MYPLQVDMTTLPHTPDVNVFARGVCGIVTPDGPIGPDN